MKCEKEQDRDKKKDLRNNPVKQEMIGITFKSSDNK